MTSSLRLRLMLLAFVSITVALTIAGIALAVIFDRHLERRVEQELNARWEELASALTIDRDGQPEISRVLTDPRYQRPFSGAYWQVSDQSGPRLRSRSLWDDALNIGEPENRKSGEAVELMGPNRSMVFQLNRQVTHEADGVSLQLNLIVALDHKEINLLRDSFVVDAAATLAGLGSVLLVGAAAQAAIGLQPLRDLRRQLGAVHEGRCHRLSGGFPLEVAPLAQDLNLLLAAQERQVAKARARAGDLAHGLKTSLTILAAEANRIDTFQPETALLLREQVSIMHEHVERELARARTRGSSIARVEVTEVALTVGKLIGVLRRLELGAALSWIINVPSALDIFLDPYDFSEVLGNLLDNARKWACTTVTVSVRPELSGFIISVIDDGPGISPAQRGKFIERGERGSSQVEGSGLGLSIVQGVLESYGTTLVIEEALTGGCSASFSATGRFNVPGNHRGTGKAGGSEPAARLAIASKNIVT